MKIKPYLDGCIFWRDKGLKVEIKIVCKSVKPMVESLLD
jgi:hypothetical protein